MTKRKTALVTGAGRRDGLGYATSRQLAQSGYEVIITARTADQSEALAASLSAEGLPVTGIAMDITDTSSVEAAATEITTRYEQLDVLINNAAVMRYDPSVSITKDLHELQQEFDTNVIGTWRVNQYFVPLLKASGHGRIVNISSAMGSFTENEWGILHYEKGPVPSYSLTKLVVNGMTVKLARELQADNILVNAVCPGFTATYPGLLEMGARPVSESVPGIIWAATLPDDGPTGKFFKDGKEQPW